MLLNKDEFMMQLLERATENDDEVEVNYKDMTVRFQSATGASSHTTYKMTKEGIVDMKSKPEQAKSNVSETVSNMPQ